MPLAWLLRDVSLLLFIAITVGVILIGIWAANVADAHWKTHDSGRIVIDEVAGLLVTVAFVDRSSWVMLLLGFVLFRAFDIIKPPPVRWFDKNMPGGAGVVLDDVAAGVLACAVLYGISLTSLPGTIASLW